MTERLAVALDLVLAALAKRQVEPAALGTRALEAHGERNGRAVFERYATSPPLEVGPPHAAGDVRLVQPRESVAGM